MKDNEPSPARNSSSAPVPPPAQSPYRILVVDDDSDARQRSVEMLAACGYDVEGVQDGAAGWEALQAKSYDLIITDNKMPRMTGLEMMEKLHAARMAVPVLMATESAPMHEFARKPWLKPDATLQRPFSKDDVLAAVKGILRTDDAQAVEQEVKQLRQQNAELERRISQRTAQLEAANLELETFSYSVSHDLRAPLRHIMGFVELLRQDAGPTLSQNCLGHLTTIAQAAKQMGQMIDGLLAFSRIGQAEMQKTEINFEQLVKEALQDFQAEIKGRNIVWEIQPLPEVRADRTLLRQALVNLISNAVQIYRHSRRSQNRNWMRSQWQGRDGGLHSRQRGGVRSALWRQAVRRVSTSAQPGRVRGHGHRLGECPAHRSPSRRPRVGRRRDGCRRHVLLFNP